jgi:hypothetical protein
MSEFHYIATGSPSKMEGNVKGPTWCMTLDATLFQDIVEQFPIAMAFITIRAI